MTRAMTAERLRELVHYDPNTGDFTWMEVSKFGQTMVGDKAGSNHAGGYKQINFRRDVYLCHRLAWLYVHGEWPSQHIDHINGNRSDNRIANLRAATAVINAQNTRQAQTNNKVGFLGVTRDKKRFVARIHSEGKKIRIGSFDTPEKAHDAYVIMKRKLHIGCTI